MQYKLEISHPDLKFVKIMRGEKILQEESCDGVMLVTVSSHAEPLSVWFEPWKIKPMVRVNGIMVNYALAGIDQFDHKIDFKLDTEFQDLYHQKDIDFRIKTVFDNKEVDEYVFDSVIGHGRMHQDILDQIKTIIDEK